MHTHAHTHARVLRGAVHDLATNKHTHTLSHICTHALCLTHSHAYIRINTHALSLTHTHTHTLTHTLTHTRARIHTHTPTHTHWHPCGHTHKLSRHDAWAISRLLKTVGFFCKKAVCGHTHKLSRQDTWAHVYCKQVLHSHSHSLAFLWPHPQTRTPWFALYISILIISRL